MDFFSSFDFQRIVIDPWTRDLASYGWIMLMGFLVSSACGLVGTYLILRRMALVGDAISHSVLPGIAIAFLFSNSRGSAAMFLGALVAGIATTLLIELIHKKSRVKQDAAIGITFSSLFAIGVILITVYASKVDLDQECVLYGEIGNVYIGVPAAMGGINLGPPAVVRMGIVALLTGVMVWFFYKELLVSSFDPGLASSLGINAALMHYAMMSWLSVVVVSSFESVGAILVIAMLILPGATASLISDRLPIVLALTLGHSAISSIGGLHLALWLDCSIAGAMVVAGAVLFLAAWMFAPKEGLLSKLLRRRFEPIVEPSA